MRADPIDAIVESLGLPETTAGWLAELAALPPAEDLRLPGDEEARAQLVHLGLTDLDRAEMLAARPTPTGSPSLWWLLQRIRRQVLEGLGGTASLLSWPDLPATLGPTGDYFYPWALLSTLGPVRDFHRQRGIPDPVSWASLADLGQQLRVGRLVRRRGGLPAPGWLSLHFRGSIYQLGRLQFQRALVPLDRIRAALPEATGDLPALSVHIPATGPMTPRLCDESFAQTPDFFGRYFPEEGYRHAVCTSWLLDPQLAEYLPEDSNIVRFQRRFQPVPADQRAPGANDDPAVLEFVFRRQRAPLQAAELDRFPQDTTLHRAIVTHLRAGRHWYFRTGWCPLP
jgi:hypothetical protein